MDKKLAELLTSKNDDLYITTLEDCLKWFGILNEVLFVSSLTPLKGIDIRRRRGAYAYYDRERLLMNTHYKNDRFFVEVLAHELVHHYQFINNEEVNHGSTFTKWNSIFRSKGIKLVTAYVEEHEDQQKLLRRRF